MRDGKSILGVAGALLPVLYCGGLVYYFVDFSGSMREAQEIGLGPTVLGLGAIGLLLSIPLILKVLRLVAKSTPPRRPDDDGGFDADAVIARYKSRQAEEPTPPHRGRRVAPSRFSARVSGAETGNPPRDGGLAACQPQPPLVSGIGLNCPSSKAPARRG